MNVHVPLSLERTTDRDCHEDLLLRLGAWRQVCDSYYLAGDQSPTMGPDIPSAIARLLEQWVDQLERLRGSRTTVFLPFDFSDECTGWLRVVSRAGDRLTVEAGWSGIEGWSFYPSNIAAMADRVDDFAPVLEAVVECGLDDLITAIAENRAEFVQVSQ